MQYALALFTLAGALAAPSERRQFAGGEDAVGNRVPSTLQIPYTNKCVQPNPELIGDIAEPVQLQECEVVQDENERGGAKDSVLQGWIRTGNGLELASQPDWCLSVAANHGAVLAPCGLEHDEIRTTELKHNGVNICLMDGSECFMATRPDDSIGWLTMTPDRENWAPFTFPTLVE